MLYNAVEDQTMSGFDFGDLLKKAGTAIAAIVPKSLTISQKAKGGVQVQDTEAVRAIEAAKAANTILMEREKSQKQFMLIAGSAIAAGGLLWIIRSKKAKKSAAATPAKVA